jgi:hypothetical protein
MASKKMKKSSVKPAKVAKSAKVAAAPKKSLGKVASKVVQKVSTLLANKKKAVVPAKVIKGKVAPLAKPVKNSKTPIKAAAPVKAPKGKVPVVASKPVKGAKLAAPIPAAIPSAPVKGKKGKVVAVEVSVSTVVVKGKVKGQSSKAAKKAESLSLKKRCREPGCDNDPLVGPYCRLHYIKNWKKIKRKEAIIAAGQLNSYVEELVNKYPDKYLDVIRQDLASEKDWAKVVSDLELDSVEDDLLGEDEAESAAEGGRRGSERDFDDDSDSF